MLRPKRHKLFHAIVVVGVALTASGCTEERCLDCVPADGRPPDVIADAAPSDAGVDADLSDAVLIL